MKRYILPLFVLCLALLCAPLAVVAQAASTDYRPGDANSDGKVNTTDITTLRRYISDGRTTDPNGYNVVVHENAADVDANGRINTMDITLIRRYIADNWTTDPDGYNVVLKPGKMDCTHTSLTAVAEKQPTCSEPGNIAYWDCDGCDKYYADAEGKYEILLEETVLAAGHDFETLWSYDRDGHWHNAACEHLEEVRDDEDHSFVDHKCSVCGADETVSVTFQDYTGSVIGQQYIVYGADAQAPAEIPERTGYLADGWDQSFQAVTADITVNAQYVKAHTVTFQDHEGNVLKQEVVRSGDSATAPNVDSLPVPEGYKRTGWDKAFENVTEDITVSVAYEKLMHTVTFCMPDGSVIENVEVEHGADAQEPVCSQWNFDWSSYTMGAFSGWSDSLKEITADTTVYAQYLLSYEQPVISIETTGNTAAVKLYDQRRGHWHQR